MPTQAEYGGIAERQVMAKVQQLAEITPNLPLTEYDFYEFFRTTFETSELGKMKRLLPLRKMADNLGLVRRGTMPRRGSRPYFTAEGKVALMFLKMYTGLSCPKTDGTAEREHPLPDVLRRDNRPGQPTAELQAPGRHNPGCCWQAEDTQAVIRRIQRGDKADRLPEPAQEAVRDRGQEGGRRCRLCRGREQGLLQGA